MAEGVKIEAPRGRGMGRGCPPPQPSAWVWRSVVSSPAGSGAASPEPPAENEFGAFCGRKKDADSNYLLTF